MDKRCTGLPPDQKTAVRIGGGSSAYGASWSAESDEARNVFGDDSTMIGEALEVKVQKSYDDEEKRWRQCMIASATRTLAKHHDEMAKDAKIQPLAVRLTAIAGSFRSAEDVISVSDPLVKQLENVVNELTVELAGGKPNLPRNGQRGKAANANHRARGSRDKDANTSMLRYNNSGRKNRNN
ncbi:unnamed protein product [Acanthoscelides obtectus]|uniref:Uncharacterized protein n=1 Tax=Acanthoscelides obtectus TaxID=200917 RepID=A0A9P0QHX8_ACAOB|nr:unnamed protein product [Acanthoscelides obtectus]CAK1683840.1 hypothetical protein AOBTE_LOCUS34484 [Acanthoscelides obtectus]